MGWGRSDSYDYTSGISTMENEISSIIEFSQDISSAEAPELLPEGSYAMSITQVEVKVSVNSGNKYAAIHLHVKVEDFPADFPVENAPDGVSIIYRRVVLEDTGQARYGLHRFCEAVGAPMSTNIDTNDWVGLEVTGEVAHSEWQGEGRVEVTSVGGA